MKNIIQLIIIEHVFEIPEKIIIHMASNGVSYRHVRNNPIVDGLIKPSKPLNQSMRIQL